MSPRQIVVGSIAATVVFLVTPVLTFASSASLLDYALGTVSNTSMTANSASALGTGFVLGSLLGGSIGGGASQLNTIGLTSTFNMAAADAMCTPVVVTPCGCGKVMGAHGCKIQTNWYMCPNHCVATLPGGVVTGHCTAPNICHADTYTNLSGGTTGLGGSTLMQLGSMVGQLMNGSGSTGMGSTGDMSTTGTTAASGCESVYYQTSTPSSDPCAIYVPASATNSDSNDALSQLLGQLNGGSSLTGNSSGVTGSTDTGGTSIGDQLNQLSGSDAGDNTNSNTNSNGDSGSSYFDPSYLDLVTGNTNTNTNANANTSTNTNAFPIDQNADGETGIATGTVSTTLGTGANGNIVIGPNGVTVTANSTDGSGNTETAGFLGLGSAVNSVCSSRPWASGFLSYIITPSFFDNLCQHLGYEQNAPANTTTSTGSQQPTLSQQSFTTGQESPQTGVNTIPPQVRIWAAPTAVPLGARTSIFWDTEGVVRCTETSPDGNFSQNSLQGSGSTVPLTGATTFTISCQAPDGTPVSDSVTVQIAI